MVLALGDDFEFVLAIFHWDRSPTFLLMIVPIPTFLPLFLPSSITSFPHLRLLLETFTGMYSYFCPHLRLFLRTFSWMYAYLDMADVHQCSKVDFPYCCFVCRFMTSFYFLSTAAFASEINHCLEWKTFSSEAHVTLDSRDSLSRTTSGVHTRSQHHTWEYFVLTGS